MRPELTKDIQETSIYVLNRPKFFYVFSSIYVLHPEGKAS